MSANEVMLRAHEELERGRTARDRLVLRQAAEKAFLAVVEATDAWLHSKGIHVPEDESAHRKRRQYLSIDHPEWARAYADFATFLHGDIFYHDAEYPEREVNRFFREAAAYVQELA